MEQSVIRKTLEKVRKGKIMKTKPTLVIKALVVATLLAASLPASAEHGERHGERHGGWHGDIRHFESHDMHTWRAGNWHHVRHGDRLGWWWVAAGVWYFYPEPVYPYPDPYIPPVVVVQPAPQPAPAPAPVIAAPAQSWYYCETSKSYYPYVSTCPAGWKTVPATPSVAPVK